MFENTLSGFFPSAVESTWTSLWMMHGFVTVREALGVFIRMNILWSFPLCLPNTSPGCGCSMFVNTWSGLVWLLSLWERPWDLFLSWISFSTLEFGDVCFYLFLCYFHVVFLVKDMVSCGLFLVQVVSSYIDLMCENDSFYFLFWYGSPPQPWRTTLFIFFHFLI